MSQLDDGWKFHPPVPHTGDAALLIPCALRLAGREVQSVVDFGCNNGQWLAACERAGITDVIGVDGDDFSPCLLFDPSKFVLHDLREPLDLDRRFDMAMCVETAEHLPEDRASVLLDTLVRHSDLVLFSAARPGQGGHGHLNEQWFDWWEKLFASRGFSADLTIRECVTEDCGYWHNNTLAMLRRR